MFRWKKKSKKLVLPGLLKVLVVFETKQNLKSFENILQNYYFSLLLKL